MNKKIQLILIFMAFFAPVILAIWLSGWWVPTSTKNHGQLVRPAQPLPAFSTLNQNQESLTEKSLRGHWVIMQASENSCDEACQNLAQQLRQLHIATGKHAHRLRRVFWTADPKQTPEAYEALFSLAWPNEEAMQNTLNTYFNGEGVDAILVDPRGYIALRYPPGFDPNGLRKDLSRLLTYAKEDDLTEIPPQKD